MAPTDFQAHQPTRAMQERPHYIHEPRLGGDQLQEEILHTAPHHKTEPEVELGAVGLVLKVGDVEPLHCRRGALDQDAVEDGPEVRGAGYVIARPESIED